MRQKDPRPFDKVHPVIARGALNFLLSLVAKSVLAWQIFANTLIE